MAHDSLAIYILSAFLDALITSMMFLALIGLVSVRSVWKNYKTKQVLMKRLNLDKTNAKVQLALRQLTRDGWKAVTTADTLDELLNEAGLHTRQLDKLHERAHLFMRTYI